MRQAHFFRLRFPSFTQPNEYKFSCFFYDSGKVFKTNKNGEKFSIDNAETFGSTARYLQQQRTQTDRSILWVLMHLNRIYSHHQAKWSLESSEYSNSRFCFWTIKFVILLLFKLYINVSAGRLSIKCLNQNGTRCGY